MVSTVNFRKVAAVLVLLQFIGISQVSAATPKPKVTATKVATPKSKITKTPTQKKAVVPTKKKVVTPTKKKVVTPTKKKVATPAKKKAVAPVKKKVAVKKYVARKIVPKKVQPSPKIKWPPSGYTSIGTAYARVPTGQELIGLLSAMKDPTAKINSCALDPKNPSAPAFACAAILVGSTQKCTWWRISSTMTGNDSSSPDGRVTLGDLTTYQSGAAAKTIQTIFLVSPVPLHSGIMFTAIHALCGIGPSTDPVPGTTFVPAPSSAPTPSPSPTNS